MRWGWLGVGGLALGSGAGCGGPHSMMDAASDAAATIVALWWILFWVCLVVFVAVLAGFAYAVFRRRPAGADPEPTGGMIKLIVWAGAVVPGVILAGLVGVTIESSNRLTRPDVAGAVEIDVVGRQFWWEVRYPAMGAVTANEIHIPVGRPARLRLRSEDVIHSLWVPRLHGKLDLTPGRVTELVLNANQPGLYRGFCAEYCGVQHALMGLLVVAQPEAEFEAWVRRQAEPADVPLDPDRMAGHAAFVRHDCDLCHRVRGMEVRGTPIDVGPDLTHVGARRTLGAVTVANTPADLAAWIRDPHGAKPGVLMPPTELPAGELEAMVRYLSGLR